MKHTPGPWAVSKDNRGAIPIAFRSPVVLAFDGTYEIACGIPAGVQGEANAKLIAAAPELLEVLERCADFMCSVAHGGRGQSKVSQTFIQACKDARAIIKKAKGES